jgi:thiamine kinase-like enzyme
LEHLLGSDWEIISAGGATGKAFFGQHGGQQYFLKRNSSPFLAVLSAEGIVPKLVWTRRLENGDVITAQHWLQGRELKPEEMVCKRVASLMSKIHTSQPLLSMLERLGKRPTRPAMILQEIDSQLDEEMIAHPVVRAARAFLEDQLANVRHEVFVLCHGDINHNNWLLSDEDDLYLIDWDGAMIGDPAMDLGMLLHEYISSDEREKWLAEYGLALTPHLELRMRWYALAQMLLGIQWDKERSSLLDVDHRLASLRRLI